MNEKLSKIKSQIKKHKTEIITAAIISVPLTVTYVLYMKKFAENIQRFPVGETTFLATQEQLKPVTEEGYYHLIWTIAGHNFDLVYDPDC